MAADPSELLTSARAAYRRREWDVAREAFTAARAAERLSGEDLYWLGNCHWWLGALGEALPILHEAYRALVDEGTPRPAALVALDAGYSHALRGEDAQASGWISRAARLLAAEPECAEQGFLVYLAFENAWDRHRLEDAMARAHEVQTIGERFGEVNLCALGVLGQGRVLVKQGHVPEGMALLDEAMLAAVSDDLDPGWAGNIYCHLMLACYELADWARAHEWTAVTARWCDAMPGAGPFMGICRVHRAQVLQARGDWAAAESEVLRVCDELAGFHVSMVAEAHYQLGDLRRQRGDTAGARAEFVEARRLGRVPQPGHALMLLAEGRATAANVEVGQALGAAGTDPLARSRLLPAAVEIAVALGDLQAALSAAIELRSVADLYGTAGLAALAARAEGIVALAERRPADALAALTAALACCLQARVPYDSAITRLLLADAQELAGHPDAAAAERALGDAELARLGMVRPPAIAVPHGTPRADGLTPREAEVLELVAEGLTNQEVADRLVLSVRTVERHLTTVYQKLGLEGRNARAAAVRHALTTWGRPAG